MSEFEVVATEGQAYEGRQWGWTILKDGHPYLRCTTGGTGSCWNIANAELVDAQTGAPPDEEIHVCELDELIEALQALRDSKAHRENLGRWA